MEEIDVIESLGNMGVVPIVIFVTQAIKKTIGDFKYGSDAMAAILSFVLCIGWEFYYMTSEAYIMWSELSGHGFFKWLVVMGGTGFATWLAASKIYDFGHGNKKRQTKVLQEKKILEEKIVVLQNGNGKGEEHEEIVEEDDFYVKLREILEKGT